MSNTPKISRFRQLSWLSCANSRIARSGGGATPPSKIWVAGLLVLSAVACGGTARLDGGSGAEAGGGTAGHAGTPYTPGSSGGRDWGSGAGGAPSPGGAPSAGGTPPSIGGTPGASGGSGATPGAGGDGSCVVGGTRYANGASWACDCNTCFCRNGSFGSTAVGCVACFYGGQGHLAGETFKALDGCNTCRCEASGQVACTDAACACAPGVDGLHYLITNPDQCLVADYICPANTHPFHNACGCGCAQAADCPPYIDCQPGPVPTSCAALKEKCPYSTLAL
jgi:hypothetical protein